MRTSSKTVTFVRPFMLRGLDGPQPAGSYVVETDEELLLTLLHPASQRMATWLVVPSRSLGGGFTQFVNVDPTELQAALARDAVVG